MPENNILIEATAEDIVREEASRNIRYCKYDGHLLTVSTVFIDEPNNQHHQHKVFTCPNCGKKYRYMMLFVEEVPIKDWIELR